jgi:kynurenine 3-monooxygenase
MSSTGQPPITIVGAGLGGALMACYLARAGFQVTVYESRPDPRTKGFLGGRSINLALSARGLHALEEVGLAEKVLADVTPMRGRMMHDRNGGLTFQAYSKNAHDAINSVSRGGLNLTLLEAAASHDRVELVFGQRCVGVDLDPPRLTLRDEQTGKQRTVDAGVIIGADGAYSAVRGRLLWTDRFNYHQAYLEHGYKELTIPPTPAGEYAMDPNALHIWPRGGHMMIALPNQDRSFTCTVFWPYLGDNGFESVQSPSEIQAFFQSHFSDAVPLMPTLVNDYQQNPTGSLLTVRCSPWHYKDQAVLLGDAAHAIVPFFGQGMNCAFEDCSVLSHAIAEHVPDFKAVFAAYENARKPHADAIADLALHNFIEMRDHVGSSSFLVRKKLEQALHAIFPQAFLPLYNMVSFTCIPYAEARDRARRQARIIRTIITSAGVVVLLALVLFLGLLMQ